MRESRKYLWFFLVDRNWLILLIFLIVGIIVGWGYNSKLAPIYGISSLYQISFTNQNINDRSLVTDLVVGQIRDIHIKKMFYPAGNVNISAVKTGPLMLRVNVNSSNKLASSEVSQKVANYLETNFQASRIGDELIEVIFPNLALSLMVGALCGAFISLLLCLIRSYLKYF